MAIKQFKPEPLVKHAIHRKMARFEKARDTGKLHASDLFKDSGFCPRAWAFRMLYGVKEPDSFISTSLALTFEYGRFFEDLFRDTFFPDDLIGRWSCRGCGEDYKTIGLRPKGWCNNCSRTDWVYQEVVVFDDETGVIGSIDGLLNLGRQHYRVIELKTMDKDLFKALVAPMIEHRTRTSLYMYLMAQSNLLISDIVRKDIAHILYMVKGFGFKDTTIKAQGIKDAEFSPFKEFVIKREDSLYQTELNMAKALRIWQKAGENPHKLPCGVCLSKVDSRASKCPYSSYCFQESNTWDITWKEKSHVVHQAPIVAECNIYKEK